MHLRKPRSRISPFLSPCGPRSGTKTYIQVGGDDSLVSLFGSRTIYAENEATPGVSALLNLVQVFVPETLDRPNGWRI